MSVEKQKLPKTNLKDPQIITIKPKVTLQPTLPLRQAFFLQLKQADGNTGVLWARQFTPKIPRQQGITIKFPKQSFTLSNQISSFPDIIWLASSGFAGYLDNTGTATQRMVGFSLSLITSTDYNGVMTYNAVYENPEVQVWDLASNSTIAFKVYINEDTTAYGTLDQQLNIKMDVYYRD